MKIFGILFFSFLLFAKATMTVELATIPIPAMMMAEMLTTSNLRVRFSSTCLDLFKFNTCVKDALATMLSSMMEYWDFLYLLRAEHCEVCGDITKTTVKGSQQV